MFQLKQTNQTNLNMMNCIQQSTAHRLNLPSTSQILMEALGIPLMNLKLFLPLLLLSLLSSSLFLTNYLSSLPLDTLALYSISIYPTDPLTPNFLHLWRPDRAGGDQAVRKSRLFFLMASFTVASLVKIATLHGLAMTHAGKLPTLRDVIAAMRRAARRSIVTQSCVAVLHLASTALLTASLVGISMIAWATPQSHMFTASLCVFLALWGGLQYLHLATIWLLSMVVSVEEDGTGCGGAAAIWRAEKLIAGKRRQGISVTAGAVVLVAVATVGYGFAVSVAADSTAAWVVVGVIYVGVVSVLSMLTLAVNVVFYGECRRSRHVIVGLDDGC